MARPKKPKSDVRDRLLQVRMQAKEYQTFQDAAEQSGLDLSAWVRSRLRDAALRDKKKYILLSGEDSK